MYEAQANPSIVLPNWIARRALPSNPLKLQLIMHIGILQDLLCKLPHKLLCHDPSLASSACLLIHATLLNNVYSLFNIMHCHNKGIQVCPSSKYIRVTNPCIELYSPWHDPLGCPWGLAPRNIRQPRFHKPHLHSTANYLPWIPMRHCPTMLMRLAYLGRPHSCLTNPLSPLRSIIETKKCIGISNDSLRTNVGNPLCAMWLVHPTSIAMMPTCEPIWHSTAFPFNHAVVDPYPTCPGESGTWPKFCTPP